MEKKFYKFSPQKTTLSLTFILFLLFLSFVYVPLPLS